MTWLKGAAFTGFFSYCLYRQVGYIAQVDGRSMEPTLNDSCCGNNSKSVDWVFVNHWAYQNEPLRRGDIVVAKSHKGDINYFQHWPFGICNFLNVKIYGTDSKK